VTWRPHVPAAKTTGGGGAASPPPAAGVARGAWRAPVGAASVAPHVDRVEEARERCARRCRSGSGVGHGGVHVAPPPDRREVRSGKVPGANRSQPNHYLLRAVYALNSAWQRLYLRSAPDPVMVKDDSLSYDNKTISHWTYPWALRPKYAPARRQSQTAVGICTPA